MKNEHPAVDAGAKILGSRIVLRARKISGPHVVADSGRHQAQQAIGTNNARAWIEIPLRAVAEMKERGDISS